MFQFHLQWLLMEAGKLLLSAVIGGVVTENNAKSLRMS